MRTLLSPSKILALLCFSGALGLVLAPAPDGMSWEAKKAAGLVVFTIGFLATGVLPEVLTALAFFAVATLLAVAAPDVIFAGWTSTALWLVFGGLVIGLAVEGSGLADRIASNVTRAVGVGYTRHVTAMVVVGVVMAFLMPSTMGRVILLMPIVMALADRLGYAEGSPGRIGLVIAMAYGTWMPSAAILPANVPNMVLAGASETLFDLQLTYGSYLILHFPVAGALKALLILGLVLVMFRGQAIDAQDTSPPGPWSREEKLLSVVLFVTLGLWATDFLHGISPAWIGLAAAVVCLMPGIGLVAVPTFNQKLNFSSMIYVASILSLGAVVVDSGLGDWVGERALGWVPLDPSHAFWNFMTLTGLSSLVSVLATAPGVVAILSPFAEDFGHAAGFSTLAVLMTQILGYSTILLPYQVPPLIVALQLGRVPVRQAGAFTAILAMLTYLTLAPLSYLWWVWIGQL